MSDDNEPAWIDQARKLWDYLNDHAELNEYQQLIFKGSLLEAYRHTGASNSNYTRIRRLLEAHGVIRVVQRGNRHQASVIEITGALPTSELLPPGHLTDAESAATLVAGMEKQVQSLIVWRESLEKGGLNLAEAVRNFELRITRLEREVRKIGSQTTSTKRVK